MAPRPAGCPILTRKAPDRRCRDLRRPGRGAPAATTVGRCATPRPPGSTSSRTCTDTASPTPTAGSRTPPTRAPQAWTRGPGRPRRRGAGRPCRCARSSPPGWRSWCTPAPSACRSGGAGGRSPPAATPARSTPSCGSARPTAPCACWSTRWRSTPRGRRRSTPGRRRGRATGWPTSSPPAATRSRGSTSSTSPPARCVDGPVDRCRYSPVAWLPGGEELFYVRRLAPDQVPAGEEQFHRRVWRHRVGAAGRRRRARARRGQRPDHLLRRAHQPRRPLAGRLRLGRHRARATTSGSPTSPATARCATSRSASTRRPPPGWPATAGCG